MPEKKGNSVNKKYSPDFSQIKSHRPKQVPFEWESSYINQFSHTGKTPLDIHVPPPATEERPKVLGFQTSSGQAYSFDPNKANLSKPYDKNMFSSKGRGGNLGAGISALAGQAEENRKTEGSSYVQDFSAVYEYNQLMKQLKD